MFNVDVSGRITLTRGDTASPPLFLNKGTDLKPLRHILQDGEEVYFAIMEPNQPFECAIVKKLLTKDNLNKYGDVVINIEHDDTRLLLPGKYFYQIKASIYNSEKDKYEINTVVQKTEFTLEE